MNVPSWFARCFASSLVTFNFFVNASRAEVSRLEFESHLIRQPTVEKIVTMFALQGTARAGEEEAISFGFSFLSGCDSNYCDKSSGAERSSFANFCD